MRSSMFKAIPMVRQLTLSFKTFIFLIRMPKCENVPLTTCLTLLETLVASLSSCLQPVVCFSCMFLSTASLLVPSRSYTWSNRQILSYLTIAIAFTRSTKPILRWKAFKSIFMLESQTWSKTRHLLKAFSLVIGQSIYQQSRNASSTSRGSTTSSLDHAAAQRRGWRCSLMKASEELKRVSISSRLRKISNIWRCWLLSKSIQILRLSFRFITVGRISLIWIGFIMPRGMGCKHLCQ